MSLASVIRSMAAAGAPPEAIAIAVEAIEAAQAQVDAIKAKARDKKRAQRAASRDTAGTVPGQSGDMEGTVPDQTPSPALSPSSSPDPSNNPTPTHTPARSNASAHTHAKGTRLGEDFEPKIVGQTAEMVSRWPPGRFDREVAQFRDHYAKTGGDKGLSRDWQASLRTWLRNADDRIPRNGHPAANDRPTEHHNPMVRAGIAREARFAGRDPAG